MNAKKPYSIKRRMLLAVIACGFILGLYGSCVEPFTVRLQEWNVATPKWQGQKELKIILLSDAHMIWPWMTPRHMERIINRVNALKPDIVLLLGDYVATHPFGLQLHPDEALAVFENLSAACGVYAVMGNHDFDAADARWAVALRKIKIPVLENKASKIECDGRKFWIAGLEDWWKQKADINQTLAQVKDDFPVIMMMHNPDPFAVIPDSVALSVAGHTHGGQIRIPFYGPVPAVIPSEYGLRYVYGHVQEDGKDLVVTSGLGMTGLPIRFLAPPEIAIVNLKSE